MNNFIPTNQLRQNGHFSRKAHIPKLTQQIIENLNRLVTCTEIELVIYKKNLSINKSPG